MMKRTDRFTFFWGTADEFSNFHPAPIVIHGYPLEDGAVTKFPTSEHAYMWIKAIFHEDYTTAEKIVLAPTAKDAKRLGRQVKDFDEVMWNDVSYEVMHFVCDLKFIQNEHLRKILIDSAGTILVEASPVDKIWGVGLSAEDPDILDQSKWQGENRLGSVLMRIRAKYIYDENFANNFAPIEKFLKPG